MQWPLGTADEISSLEPRSSRLFFFPLLLKYLPQQLDIDKDFLQHFIMIWHHNIMRKEFQIICMISEDNLLNFLWITLLLHGNSNTSESCHIYGIKWKMGKDNVISVLQMEWTCIYWAKNRSLNFSHSYPVLLGLCYSDSNAGNMFRFWFFGSMYFSASLNVDVNTIPVENLLLLLFVWLLLP